MITEKKKIKFMGHEKKIFGLKKNFQHLSNNHYINIQFYQIQFIKFQISPIHTYRANPKKVA